MGTRTTAAVQRWMAMVGVGFAFLAGCAAPFDRYSAGAVELWIGGQTQVHQECERRGVVLYSVSARILGCTDFRERVIISISDPKILAHEMCHWSMWTDSHEVCRTPVLP